MKKNRLFFLFLFLFATSPGAWALVETTRAPSITRYNVEWDSPSKNAGGSMPLGNGEMGMNVWVEEGGDLLFYLSRTDVMSEANRLMKIGRVRVSLSPNPFEKGVPFRQVLKLDEGTIEIRAGKAGEETVLKVYLDQNHHTGYVTVNNEVKREVKVTVESWRRAPHRITKAEAVSAWLNGMPDWVEAVESADRYLNESSALALCHVNESSIYDLVMSHQQKEAYAENFPDPIRGRVWGVYMTADNLAKASDSTLTSKGAVKTATLKFSTLSEQVDSDVKKWTSRIKAQHKASNAREAYAASRRWWSDYWYNSYIYIDTPKEPQLGKDITQAYVLQRYMQCGSGRGNFPIKFNGSIFTVDPAYVNSGMKFSPDYRNWGNDFWWQNTRLPYYAMLPSGDFEQMKPLFDFYLSRMDAFRTLARKYYNAEGAFIPETVTIFGTYANGEYGWDRTGVDANYVESPYIRYIWVQGLELSKLMMDYYRFSGDETFFKEQALPAIKDFLLYFDSRFVKDGKMRIDQTQSLETYWYNVVNDMPSVVGLHYVLGELETLPEGLVPAEDARFYTGLKKTLPPIPRKSLAQYDIFLPAESFLEQRSNVENPELYPLFPFGVANFANDLYPVAFHTYRQRNFNSWFGWGQDGQHAAMLRLTDEVVELLKRKIKNTNANQRFLAMWGPNYDWVPDQDHGSNLLMTIQMMVMQNYGADTYLLPAFPKDWNVVFKLHTTDRTIVEGEYFDGELKTNKRGKANILPLNNPLN